MQRPVPVGTGDSDTIDDSGPDSYSFLEHRRYLDRLLEQIKPGERDHGRW